MVKSRIFLYSLLSFIVGVAVRSFVAVPYFLMWFGILCAAAIAVWGILRKEKEIIVYGFLVLVLVIGIFRFDQVGRAQPDLSPLYGRPLAMRGVIWEEPERHESTQRLKVKIAKVESKLVAPQFFTLVTVRRHPGYQFGDELEILGVLEKPGNFGEFDYAAYLSREDIFSVMSFPIIEKRGEGKGSWLTSLLFRSKRAFEKNIDVVLPEPHAAFLKGLLLGERESLPKELVENFNRTGTTHIVALSGYNITLVADFFLGLLLFLTVPFFTAFWIAIGAIVLFVLLTGASPSVVRAGVMGILVLVAQREGRMYHMTNALAFTAAVMIFQNPKILRFDAAFELSFLATAGLVYLSPRVEKRVDRVLDALRSLLQPDGKRPRVLENATLEKHRLFPLKRILVETLSAQLMVLPLLISLFGRVSLVSLLSNVFVLIAVPYAMMVGFLSGILGFLWEPLSTIVAWPLWVLLEYKIRVIELFAKFPAAAVPLPVWFVWPLCAMYVLVFWRLWRKSKEI